MCPHCTGFPREIQSPGGMGQDPRGGDRGGRRPHRPGGMACGGTVGAAICRPGVSAPAEGRFHEGCAPHCVVAKSAGLRFRLRRKLHPLPCASSPHRAGRGGGPGLRHQKENGPRPVEEKKALRRASVQWPSARDGGRRIGASVDFALPSGTLQSSAKSVLLSRGGWCRPRRGARTHLGCFSFTVSRCGAPSISVTSVPLVPPSARSACPQGARRIRKRQSRQRLRSRYALPGQSRWTVPADGYGCSLMEMTSHAPSGACSKYQRAGTRELPVRRAPASS